MNSKAEWAPFLPNSWWGSLIEKIALELCERSSWGLKQRPEQSVTIGTINACFSLGEKFGRLNVKHFQVVQCILSLRALHLKREDQTSVQVCSA